MNVAIGIDLGTTNSCVGLWNYSTNTVDIIPNEEGRLTTPSVVGFTKNGRVFGEAAVRQQIRNPKNTIYEIKRLIGRAFDDPLVQNDIDHWPFDVIEMGDNKPNIHVELDESQHEILRPEQISAEILHKMKSIAQHYVSSTYNNNEPTHIVDAVITVPAYFNDGQRQATRDAGLIAGLNVLRIIPEPTAAAIAYGLDQAAMSNDNGGDLNVLVFDLGGGTFDVSLLSFNHEDQIFEVRAIAGDSHLGGADFDQRLIDHFTKKFEDVHGISLEGNHRANQKMRFACERAKKSLSMNMQTMVEIDSLVNDVDYCTSLSRVEFEEMCADLFEKCMNPVKKVLFEKHMDAADVHEIVLVGGSTRIPKIQELLSNFFGGKPLCKSINPDEAVAYGASIQAAIMTASGPDQLEGVPDILLLDVSPLSLGVELVGGLMSTVIKRNTTIPTSRSKMFSTSEDDQDSVTIKVYEGERTNTKHNRLLGTFELTNVDRQPRGQPKIEVQFELDADGILKVRASDITNGVDTAKSKELTIKNEKGRLSDVEITDMIENAKRYRDEDEEFQKQVRGMTAFENFLYEMRRVLTQDTLFLEKCTPKEMDILDTTFKEEWKWFHEIKESPTVSAVNGDQLMERLDRIQSKVIVPIIETVNKRISI